ncbi:Maf family nucleotide pyrophosphatase [Dyadobacter frigoris]|uniref:dTTP/UTP pyrophosphatase n=1 Tax=Dyadobacter frigoris TaxID=2576211 RepID=A0A4U6CXL8_9BACT|nr:Maf family nucleotide pyrophosphatase [Dyadobacter frigoris]TKT88477.1 septum formation protein Maf [Dyadobacter frigoris]GLU54518.1 Maf-like protein [Dyadobacter frigoris]
MFQLTRPLILASNSPRRKQLLQETGFEFEVKVLPTDESFPDNIPTHEVAGYISSQKAEVFRNLHPEKIILTADTVVIIGETILNKPKDIPDAVRMLKMLSGNTHEVTTAVSLLADDHVYTISDTALVSFRTLEETEINYYIEHYKPFDKAGAYGVQEWIGMVGINRIEGSFYTIMGLPVHVVYQLLKPFLKTQS